jgi:antitoxin VapB
MALNIEDPATDRIVRDLAEVTGESTTETVRKAVSERLDRERRERGMRRSLAEELDELGKECAALPDYDKRSPDEIIGYDENGMW